MKDHKRVLISTMWLVLGAAISAVSIAGKADSFWAGMGSALIVVGLLQLLRNYRLNKNEEYKEKREILEKDERLKYIRHLAWSWAGYIFVLTSAIFVIVFKVAGKETLSMAAAAAECFMLILYWGAYTILNKKY